MDFDDRLHSSLTSPLLTGTSPLHSARLLHRSPRGGFLAPRTTHYFSNPISANELSPTQDFRQLDSRRSSISLDQPFSILPSAAAGGQPITHSNDASMWSSSMEVKLPFEATPSPSNSFHGMQMQLQQPNQQQRMPQIFNFAQANTHSPPVPAHPLAQSQLNQQQQQQPLQQNIIAPQVGLKGAKLDELTPFTVPTTNYTQSYQQLLLQQQQQQQLMQQLTAATMPHLSPFQTNLSNSDEHQLHATPPSTSSALSMQSPLVSVMSSDSMASSPQISLLQQQLAGMPHSLQMHGMAPQSMAASIAMPPLHPQLQSFIIPPMQSPQQVLHGNRAMPTLATVLPGAAPILAATISTDSLKMPIMARTVSEERKANGNVSSKKDKSSNNNQQQMSGVQPAKTTASTPELVASFTSPLARPLDSLPSSSSSNTLNVGVGTPLMPGAFDQQASNKSPSPFALARSSPSSASASPATALSETIGGLQPQSIVNVSNILAGIASPAPLGKRTVKATQAALAANEEKNKAANARAKKQTEGNGNAHKKQDASESIPSAPAVVRGQSGSKVKNESAVKKESPVAEEKKSKKAAEKSKKKKRREDDSEDDEDSDDAAEDEEESNEASDKSSNESDEEDNSEEEEDDDDDGSDDDEEEDDDDDDDSGKRPKKRRKISASAPTEAPIFVRKPGQKLKGAEFTHIAKPVEISTSTMIPGVVPPLPTGKKKARGNSCHQCKTRRTNNDLIGCGMIHIKKPTGIRIRKRKRERRCRKKYCERCLEKFYGEEAPEKIAPGLPNTYACPGCRGLCTCAACMRAGSKRKEVQDAVAAVQAGKPTPFVVKQMAAAAAAGASGHSVSAKGKGVKGKGKPAGNSSKSSTGGSKPSSTTSSPRVTSNGNPKKVQSKNGSSSGASTPTSKSSKKRVSEANGSTTKRVKQEASVDTASVDSPSNHITPVTTPKLMARSGGKGKIGLHHSTAPKLLPSSAPVSSNTSTTTAHMDDGDHHSHEDTDMHDEHVSSAVSHSADESIAHESEGDEEHHAQISPNPPMHQHVVDGTTFLSPRHGDTSCTPSSLLLNTHHHHHHARRTSPFQGGFDSYSPRPSYQSHLHSPQSAMRRMSQSARRQSLGLAALGLQPDLAELM